MNVAEGIKIATGVLVAGLAAMGSWLLLSLVRALGGTYPVISWLGLVPLLAVTALVLVMAWQVRRYVQGKGRPEQRPSPQRARATLVGAQAAALGGAALLGWYTANALVHIPLADVPSQRVQLVWGIVHAVAALALGISGYVGQAWCRIPPSDDDEDGTVANGDLAYG